LNENGEDLKIEIYGKPELKFLSGGWKIKI